MKKLILILTIICMATQMSGCTALRSVHRDVEKLLVMQTIGLDRRTGGVTVSLASAAGSGEDGEATAPVRLSGGGESINGAIERLHEHSTGKELFCAHTTHVLVGEEAARQGVESFLAYICRSPDMRLDVPFFIVRGESAETAVTKTGDDKQGVSELLASLQENLDARSGGNILPAAEILRDIERYGGGLVCCVSLVSAQEGDTLELAGYGVMDGWKLCAFIEREDTIGVDILNNSIEVCELPIKTSSGTVTMEINEGSSELSPVWDENGRLTELAVSVRVAASVIELDAMDAGLDDDTLTALLEEAVSEQVSNALLLSRKLGVDYLGLAGRVKAASPYKFRAMEESLAQCLPGLRLRVSATGRLVHTNDVKET